MPWSNLFRRTMDTEDIIIPASIQPSGVPIAFASKKKQAKKIAIAVNDILHGQPNIRQSILFPPTFNIILY